MPNSSSVRRIRRREPHILTVYGEHPFYLCPSQKGIWRRGTPFDEDEEQLQYLSFTQPFNVDTILRPVHSWDDGNGGIAKNRKAQPSGHKLPDQDGEKKTNFVENQETPIAGQSKKTLQAEAGGSGKIIVPQSSVKTAGSGSVHQGSGSLLMNTIASLSNRTGPRKRISFAEYRAKSRAPKQSQNISGKSIPRQEIVMTDTHEENLGKKRPIEDVVGSDAKDATAEGSPYPDAKRARYSPQSETIPNSDTGRRATTNAWPAPVANGTGSNNPTQGGASTAEEIPVARDHGEQELAGKETEQRNFGRQQRSREKKTCVSATEAAVKTVGSEHEVRARKRPLEPVTGTDATKAGPATKKRAIGGGNQLTVNNQVLAPKIIQPTRPEPENTRSARDLPSLLSPTLPGWIEEEVAGSNVTKSVLAPLQTNQEFEKKVANTSIATGEPRRAAEPRIPAPQKNKRPGPAPENTGSSRDLPPLSSPTLPDWIEEEVTNRKAAGVSTPKSTLAPLWTDQEFEKKATSTSVAIEKAPRATEQKYTATGEPEVQSKPARSKVNAAPKALKSNPFIKHLKRGRRFG